MGWTRAGNAAHKREAVVSALEGSQEPIPSGWVAERSKARAWKVRIRQKRIVGSNPTPSASFKVIRSLRPPDPPALWQDSWGFWGGPIDRPGREKPKNRSPRANSLRTS